jgi:hypothetical protein
MNQPGSLEQQPEDCFVAAADLNAIVVSPLMRSAPWIALGISLAILLGYLTTGIQLFADGGFFAFAFLTGDPWNAHFVNIPARATAFLITIVPPFLLGRVSDPRHAVELYGVTFGLLPLAGLVATFWLSGNRRVLLFCSLSTIVVLPASVFFPSETLVTHALFWPLFAYLVVPRVRGLFSTFLFMLAFAFSHEGGLMLLALMLIFLLAGRRLERVILVSGLAVLATWLAVKLLFPPPFAPTRDALVMNLLGVVNVIGIVRPLLVAIVAGAGTFWLLLRRDRAVKPSASRLLILASVALLPSAVVLVVADLAFVGRYDNLLVGRYNFRTLLLGSLALFLVVLTSLSLPRSYRPAWLIRLAARIAQGGRQIPQMAFGTMLIAAGCHIMDGGNVLISWRAYAKQIRQIALGGALPVPAYIEILPASADGKTRRLTHPDRAWSMSWEWTDPFLSVVLALPMPARALVYRPHETYAPLSCQAVRSADRLSIRIPTESYDLVIRYMCELGGERN